MPTKEQPRPGEPRECPWCGKVSAPGPMVQHQKACRANPDYEPLHVSQPTGTCRWCGKTTTVGALATHERYGCSKRPDDGGDARVACRWCKKVVTMPGPLVGHERICSENPANPQQVSIGL